MQQSASLIQRDARLIAFLHKSKAGWSSLVNELQARVIRAAVKRGFHPTQRRNATTVFIVAFWPLRQLRLLRRAYFLRSLVVAYVSVRSVGWKMYA